MLSPSPLARISGTEGSQVGRGLREERRLLGPGLRAGTVSIPRPGVTYGRLGTAAIGSGVCDVEGRKKAVLRYKKMQVGWPLRGS